jgi:protein required for attachment to host cells
LEKAAQLAQGHQIRSFILVAPSRMIGFLRQEEDTLSKRGVDVKKVAKDMIKFSPQEIHGHLAKEGLLPERKKPGVYSTPVGTRPTAR